MSNILNSNRLIMKIVFYIVIVFSISLIIPIIACTNNHDHNCTPDSLYAELLEWKTWAESSSEGLWENNLEYSIILRSDWAIGEDELQPPFYAIESFDVSGNTLFVADPASQKLIALREDGTNLWTLGQPGEGPGSFSCIGQIEVGSSLILVSNMDNSRIDIVSRDGEWLNSISLYQPYDIQFYQDSLIIAASLSDPDRLINILNLDGDLVSSFGSWDDPSGDLPFCNRNLHIALSEDSLLAVSSYYSSYIQIYDLTTTELIAGFQRETPLTNVDIEMHSDGETHNFSLPIHHLDVFEGPSGMLNVLLRPFTTNKEIATSSEEIATIAVIDRFNWSGEYLDSYAIPTIAGQVIFRDGQLYVSDEMNSTLRCYIIK